MDVSRVLGGREGGRKHTKVDRGLWGWGGRGKGEGGGGLGGKPLIAED